MSDVNVAFIVGNLGQDPEEIANGKGCKFSVATNERWTDNNGQKQEETTWHDIVCWGKTAENCVNFLSKGRQVHIQGQIKKEKWEDDEGNTRTSTKIKAHRVTFLSGENTGSGGGSRRKKTRKTDDTSNPFDDGPSDPFDDDDIPF